MLFSFGFQDVNKVAGYSWTQAEYKLYKISWKMCDPACYYRRAMMSNDESKFRGACEAQRIEGFRNR